MQKCSNQEHTSYKQADGHDKIDANSEENKIIFDFRSLLASNPNFQPTNEQIQDPTAETLSISAEYLTYHFNQKENIYNDSIKIPFDRVMEITGLKDLKNKGSNSDSDEDF